MLATPASSTWGLALKGWGYIGVLKQMKVQGFRRIDILGEPPPLKTTALAIRSSACTPQPGHQGPHPPPGSVNTWLLASLSQAMPPTPAQHLCPQQAQAFQGLSICSTASGPVGSPAKEESYFYLFLLNHELNLAANQVTMVTYAGFIAVS